MIIFLYGADEYRRLQRKKFYIEEFRKKYPASPVEYFSVEGGRSSRGLSPEGSASGGDLTGAEEMDRFGAFSRGQSIFSASKMAVLENLYVAEEKAVAKLLAPLVDDKATTVIISEKKAPPGPLNFAKEKAKKAEKFEYLEGAQWLAFIREEAKCLGAKIDGPGVNFLADVYKGNTWGLVTELRKLACAGKTLSRKDLESLGLETSPDYWAVVNGIRSASVATRLRAVEKLFSQNEPAAKTFNIISSLWKEKIPQMAEYDFRIKSGKLEYEEALLGLVL